MTVIAPLFDEAWDRRRRRRRHLVTVVLTFVALALIARTVLGTGATVPPRVAHRDPTTVAPSRVLSRTPYMGVRCPVPNAVTCNRIGLAVWLKRPALSVTATVAGAPLALDDWGDLRVAPGHPRRAFTGFLQRPGLMSRLHVPSVRGTVVVRRDGHWRAVNRRGMWYGNLHRPWPTPRVSLTIREPGGRTVVTRLRVSLSPGWG